MQTILFRSLPSGSRWKRRGVAIILVLACLVLLTVMILAFLGSIGTETQSSKFYAGDSSVKLLGQSATDLAMAEIRDATANGALCWASQPGMIRTWDNTGKLQSYYKLYSDVGMVINPAADTGTGIFTSTQTQIPDGSGSTLPDGTSNSTAWYGLQGVYVDLNQPIIANGVNQYPILDGDKDTNDLTSSSSVPAAAGVPSGALVMGPLIASGTYANYPQVAGFWVNSTTAASNPTPANPSSSSYAPMPVRWLYVLKNGTMAVPSGVASGVVSFFSTDPITGFALPTPSATNPIVGRIAFWTDDDTSKVNINTAGESLNSSGNPTVWDIPRTQSAADISLSRYQPAQNEFQRYPGHPAEVSLSAVLGSLTTDSKFPECIYNTPATIASGNPPSGGIAPRLTGSIVGANSVGYWGSEANAILGTGSLEGTQVPIATTYTSTGALPLATSRLYANPDEMLFQGANRPALINVNLSNTTELDPAMLRRTEFFLTSKSRAPDVNVFNQPRICIWPVSSLQSSWTPNDQLIAFCTTINQYPYYFQRDPTTFTTGANDQYDDLPKGPPIAGTKTGVTRNRNVLEYLRTLAQLPIPGFGGLFEGTATVGASTYTGKYNGTGGGTTGKECDQILTEMFDYIRSTNSQDASITSAVPYAAIPTSLWTSPTWPTGAQGFNPGTGQIVPIVDRSNGTRGFGRFPTLYSVSLVFFPLQNTLVWAKNSSGTVVQTRVVTQVQAVMIPEMFDPSMGFPENIPWYSLQITGLAAVNPATQTPIFSWNGSSIASTGTPAVTLPSNVQMFSQDPATIGNPYGGNFVSGFSGDPQIGGMCDFRRLLLSSYTGTYQNTSNVTTAYGSWNPGYNALSASTAYIFGTVPPSNGSNPSPNSGALFSAPYPPTPASTSYSTGTAFSLYTQTSPAPSIAAAQALPSTLIFSGGALTVNVYNLVSSAGALGATPLQSIGLTLSGDTIPLPSLSGPPLSGQSATASHTVSNSGTTSALAATNLSTDYSNGYTGWNFWINRMKCIPDNNATYSITFIGDGDSVRSVMPLTGDVRIMAGLQTISDVGITPSYYCNHPAYGQTVANPNGSTPPQVPVQFADNLQNGYGGTVEWSGACYGPTTGANAITYANPSISGGIRGGTGGALVSINKGTVPTLYPSMYNGLDAANEWGFYYAEYAGFGDNSGNSPFHWCDVPTQNGVYVGKNNTFLSSSTPPITAPSSGTPGDWDNGMSNYRDGSFINKADEGNTAHGWGQDGGYFDITAFTNPATTFFSPNREIPSAGMFGSLPTGVLENLPWQTLLFRPGPAGHPGLGTQVTPPSTTALVGPPYTVPPDHLFMDLFTMPVVEPYAISEPLSTAGRINMNYQIVPFNYINRKTAITAALRSVLVTAIPDSDGEAYKQSSGPYQAPSTTPYRLGLNMSATLSQFDARFTTGAGDLFRSPSEICSIDLVPANTTGTATPFVAPAASVSPGTAAWRTAMDTEWNSFALTGDNTRERPYANLYPLLTTKSNTFTIHYRVQSLKPPVGSSATTWTESPQYIIGEYRGSQTIERYVDPNDTSIPDFTSNTTSTSPMQTLAPYYKFRVVATHQFAP